MGPARKSSVARDTWKPYENNVNHGVFQDASIVGFKTTYRASPVRESFELMFNFTSVEVRIFLVFGYLIYFCFSLTQSADEFQKCSYTWIEALLPYKANEKQKNSKERQWKSRWEDFRTVHTKHHYERVISHSRSLYIFALLSLSAELLRSPKSTFMRERIHTKTHKQMHKGKNTHTRTRASYY